ncbi:N-acetylmuramoyl-L-alanine amidase [Paracoccaceae bacterium]|nr:N-acetylmuramoyl-L-alanine amidase [Paracoccaceae bacterium]
MEFIKYPSPNYGLRRADTEIEFIILHYTAMSTEKSLERLCDPVHEVSCHYLIDPCGLCYQLVDNNKRAWHAGKSYWRGYHDLNSRSLGIELVNSGNETYPEVQMKSLIKLLQNLIETLTLNPKNILGHSDISPARKLDPGKWFNWQKLSDNGVGFFPEVSEPIACDKKVFLAEAKRAGFNPNANAEHVLKTFRNRCRPKFTGELDGYDCALMQKFADAFDIDDPLNSQ